MILSLKVFLIIPIIASIFIMSYSFDAYGNENLYVSQDIAEKNISENHLPLFFESDAFPGCTSFAPKNYHKISSYRYIDQLSPTFEVGFLKKEFPLIINSIPFTTSDFVTKSKTVPLEIGESISVKLLLFENRGPQNIQNVTMYVVPHNIFQSEKNSPSISITKDKLGPVSDPIMYYIKGQIEEDFGQSYPYGSPWASYSLNVTDFDNMFQNVTASFSKENHKLQVVFELFPRDFVPKSDLILISSDVKGNTMKCQILDVWETISTNDLVTKKSETDLLPENKLDSKLEKTSLFLFDFKTSRFDGGQPVVFSGKLISEDDTRISNSEIIIKSDSSCTSDGIIAKGITDKYGKFWIYTMPKKWNPEDNLIKIHAEFLGDDKFEPSKSQEKVITIFFSNAKEC